MEQNPHNSESDIQAIVSSLTENLAGEEREVVNMSEIREQALKKFAYFVMRNHYKNKYQKALKKAKTRILIIREIVKTEETYVAKLQLINNTLRQEMQKLLNNDDDIKKIFSNVEQILGLNEQFIDYLKAKTSSQTSSQIVNGKTYQIVQYNSQVFDNQIYQIIPFFKIYLEYLSNFEVSNNFLTKLKETKKDIREYIEDFEDKNDSISSLLITPVQRIPRYELLFKTLLEKTPSDHQDYIYTEKCYQKFIEVNQKVNSSIQRYLDNQKICELSQAFKNHQLNIIEQKREFKLQLLHQIYPNQGNDKLNQIAYQLNNINIFFQLFNSEERLNLISDGEKSCIVSFLNDLILIQERIDEESTKPIAWLSLNHASQVKSVDDMKYFTHLFKVNGTNNNLTFMADDEKKKNYLLKEIKQLINNIRQKDKRDNDLDNIEVNILGTEEWNTTKIQKFTVYVAEVNILNITLKIWVRYSQLSQLEKKIKNHIKDVEIDHFSTKFSWLNSHRTKIIEERKVQFESFLKKVQLLIFLLSILINDFNHSKKVICGRFLQEKLRGRQKQIIFFLKQCCHLQI